MVNQKVERLIDALSNQLTMRATTANALAVTKAYDGNTDAYLTISGSTTTNIAGAAVAGTQVAGKGLVLIRPVTGFYGPTGSPNETNGLGGVQAVYNPLVAQVYINSNVSTLTTVALQAATRGYEAAIISEVLKLGLNVEVYTVDKASGAFAVGDTKALQYTFVQDAFYPYAGQ